ncbi:hypothetical protein GCM10011309_09310 [Litorimonas cladophorae]|uniref:DUF2155 domain-containing protein n=1 Tax=Litorimonas cladophorae TaxID=1220491 RepID=A0A918KGB4_9PROT|nr:DUF2155 domain-containing protein [Litorimonas cladophorae]GGX61496.1 hypothetical protein GCM10011309_09310 [Litorimonas cladophorae]
MRIFAATALVLLSGMSAHAANISGSAVILRALDKVTATTQDYTVEIGDILQYGSLSIEAVHCEKRPPEELPETFAFLKIKDAKLDGKGGRAEEETVFSGWMFASRPALSALDHGVYDIWVIGCQTPEPVLPDFTQ